MISFFANNWIYVHIDSLQKWNLLSLTCGMQRYYRQTYLQALYQSIY